MGELSSAELIVSQLVFVISKAVSDVVASLRRDLLDDLVDLVFGGAVDEIGSILGKFAI